MIPRKNLSSDQLETLVRGHLDAVADEVDANRLLAGVHDRLAAERKPKVSPLRRFVPGHRAVFTLLSAAAILFLVFGLFFFRPGEVSAETLLEQTRQEHASATDRCYRVVIDLEPGIQEDFPLLDPNRELTLWTRGDRFRVRDGRLTWGRDARGRIWLAPTTEAALRFDPNRVRGLGIALGEVCDIRSMCLDTLLKDVLAGFELKKTPRDGDLVRIEAVLKPNRYHPTLESASLVVDEKRKVVTEAVLKRSLRGRRCATVSCTLVEEKAQDVSVYEPQAHIKENAPIFEWDQSMGRVRVLREHLGERGRLFAQ